MSVEKVPSWSGSNEAYVGNQCFRMRDVGSRVRLHVRRDLLRVRPEYVAVDIIKEDLVKVFQDVGLIPKPAAPKKFSDGLDDC